MWRTLNSEVINPPQNRETLLFMVHRNYEEFDAITSVAATFAKLFEHIPEIMVGIMDIADNYIDKDIFPNVNPNELSVSYLYLVRDGIAGKSFDETLNPKIRKKKRKKKKRRKYRKKTDTHHVMTFLKKYSNVLRSNESLAKILMQIDETLLKEKNNKEEAEKNERKKAGEKKAPSDSREVEEDKSTSNSATDEL